MGIFASLSKQDRSAVVALQFGTFLEYFDLMLFVHLAVILNETFFAKTDPFTSSLLAATAFCSTYIARPIGALVVGWMGDNIGRKQTIMITMVTMGLTCFVIAILPPYAAIGSAAAIIVTVCRILQGIASLGEIVGAELYLTETIKPPLQYPCVASVGVASVFGSFFALAVASSIIAITAGTENWRYCFWFGCGIAIYGAISRAKLRETLVFLRIMESKKAPIDPALTAENRRTTLMLFLTQCSYPLCFYFVYVYCGTILKNNFGYTPVEVIHNNLIVALVQLLAVFAISRMSCFIYPLKILKVKLVLFFIFGLICPYLLYIIVPTSGHPHAGAALQFLILQCVGASLILHLMPGMSIFLSHLSITHRFTSASIAHAVSRAATYVVTSFGLIFLTEWLGYLGLWFAFIPAGLAFGIGLRHFTQKEKEAQNYPDFGDSKESTSSLIS